MSKEKKKLTKGTRPGQTVRSLKKKSVLSPTSSFVNTDVNMGTMSSIGWRLNDGYSHGIKEMEKESRSSSLH